MKKVIKKMKQSLSILLAAAMVITCLPQTAIAVFAEEDAIVAEDIEVNDAELTADTEDVEETGDEEGIIEEGEETEESDAVQAEEADEDSEDADVDSEEEAAPEYADGDTTPDDNVVKKVGEWIIAGKTSTRTTSWDFITKGPAATVSLSEGNSIAGIVVKEKKVQHKSGTQGLSLQTKDVEDGDCNGTVLIPLDSDTTSVHIKVTLTGGTNGRYFEIGDGESVPKFEHSAGTVHETDVASTAFTTESENEYLKIRTYVGETKIGTIEITETKDTDAEDGTWYIEKIDDKTFNNTKQVPTVSVKAFSKSGEDTAVTSGYQVTYKTDYDTTAKAEADAELTKAGDVTVIVAETEDGGTVKADGKKAEYTYTINPFALTSANAELSIGDVTGSTLPVTVTAKLDGTNDTTLSAGDYDVTYTLDGAEVSDFTANGEYTVTVTGKGNYTGTLSGKKQIGEQGSLKTTLNMSDLTLSQYTRETDNEHINGTIFSIIPYDPNDGNEDDKTEINTNTPGTAKTAEDDASLTLSKSLRLAGRGNKTSRAIKMEAEDSGILTVYAMHSSSSSEFDRNIVLADEQDNKLGELTDSVIKTGNILPPYRINVPQAGTYYIYSEDGGVNIFYISLKYGELIVGDLVVDDIASATYNGTAQAPTVTVTSSDGAAVVEGTDYTVSCSRADGKGNDNFTDAGEITVTVTGIGIYEGKVATKTYTINPYNVNNVLFNIIGDGLRRNVVVENTNSLTIAADAVEYDVTYKFYDKAGVEVTDPTDKFAGRVEVAIAGRGNFTGTANYEYWIYSTELPTNPDVADESANDEFSVWFVYGDKVSEAWFVAAGASIKESDVREQLSYVDGDFYDWDDETGTFVVSIEGIYKDPSFTAKSKWNYATNIVDSNIILYVNASKDDGRSLLVPAIPDQTYTGAAIKPVIAVYANDGTLLKLKKDYTVEYSSNIINANVDEDGDAIEGVEQPKVIIRGKGNYATESTLEVPFNIKPVSIAADENNFAKGFTAKVTDNFVENGKVFTPLSSIKYKKKLEMGTDFTITLNGEADTSGKGGFPGVSAVGNYELKITGKGNYCGEVTKYIAVGTKANSLSKAKVKLGKNVKTLQFANIEVNSEDGTVAIISGDTSADIASETASVDTFTVAASDGTPLVPGENYNYEVKFVNGTHTKAVGKAQLIIYGTSDGETPYYGTKVVNITVKGTPVKNNLEIVRSEDTEDWDRVYSGAAQYHNDIRVKVIGSENEYLDQKYEYTITYKSNIKKGKATMTITPTPSSGYTGTLKDTFKINAAVLSNDSEDIATDFGIYKNSSGEYVLNPYDNDTSFNKAGVQPSNFRFLNSRSDLPLTKGTDYTVSYKNNKKVGTATMTIKGKGNYTGSIPVSFEIGAASLASLYNNNDENGNRITIVATSLAYKANSSKRLEPKIKVMDGTKTLAAKGKDYTVEYDYEQSAVDAYMADETGTVAPVQAKITGTNDYGRDGADEDSIYVNLSFFNKENKFSKKDTVVTFAEDVKAVYNNGLQVKPEVVVTHKGTVLEPEEYVLTYGKNNVAGKNKGSVKVEGQGKYGGSITWKFDIEARSIGDAAEKPGTNPDPGPGPDEPKYTESYYKEKLAELIADYVGEYKESVVSKVDAVDDISYEDNTATVKISETGKNANVTDVVKALVEEFKNDPALADIQSTIKDEFGEDIQAMKEINIGVTATTSTGVKVTYPKTISDPANYLDEGTDNIVNKVIAEIDSIMNASNFAQYGDKTCASLIGKTVEIEVQLVYATEKAPITLTYELKFA